MLVGEARRRRTARRRAVVAIATTAAAVTVAPVGRAGAAGFDCASWPAYSVRTGDGWYAIAEQVDVGVGELLRRNDATIDDVIVPGDRLCLPAGADVLGACGNVHTVRSGDSWFGIAERAGVSVRSLLDANGSDAERALHPGDAICLPAGAAAASSGATSASGSSRAGAAYTVRSGDSWFGIAQRAGVSARSLLGANGASSSDLLMPGDTISLPAGAKMPTAPAATWVDLDALPTQGPCWYGDTWGDGRGGGRRHLGVDIFTMRGEYVYAVADGRLTGRRWADAGAISGNSWTLTTDDGNRYFYAHLADFNPELGVGSRVEAGEIIGWVGDTGNASSVHLHFEIRPLGGEPIDPYPIVAAKGGCNRGQPYRQPSGWIPD